MSDLLVLCYHAVSPDWPADLAITPELLAEHVRLLVRRGYRGTTFTRAATDPDPQGKVAALTFDDAYRSVLERAHPILEAHGFPATVFVPTNWTGRREPMTWPGIDMWLDGSHEPELHPWTGASWISSPTQGGRWAHTRARTPTSRGSATPIWSRSSSPRAAPSKTAWASPAPRLPTPMATWTCVWRMRRGRLGIRSQPRCPAALSNSAPSVPPGSAFTGSTPLGGSGSRCRRSSGDYGRDP